MINVGHSGTHHLLFFTFGKDDTFWLTAHTLINATQCRSNRITTRQQFALIAFKIVNCATGNAGFHCSLGDSCRNGCKQARIERDRDDITRTEARTAALIGGNNIVRHVFACEFCDRIDGGDFHLIVDRGGTNVECTTENIRETQNVIDLVRIVRTACCNNRVIAHFCNIFRCDFWIGIGHGKDDRIWRHRAHHFLGQGPLGGNAEKDVSILHRFFKRALRRFYRVG